ncbi:MAG TPA: hypothetical protein VGG12_04870 [Methylovirgula sp.]|jgi:hypothetical protein
MLNKTRTTHNASKEFRGDFADGAAPRWLGFVLAGPRHEPVDALHDHIVGWTQRPRPGVPKVRESLN